jgi:hypothetical protein
VHSGGSSLQFPSNVQHLTLCLLRLLFYPEDGSSPFLLNVRKFLPDYTLSNSITTFHDFLFSTLSLLPSIFRSPWTAGISVEIVYICDLKQCNDLFTVYKVVGARSANLSNACWHTFTTIGKKDLPTCLSFCHQMSRLLRAWKSRDSGRSPDSAASLSNMQLNVRKRNVGSQARKLFRTTGSLCISPERPVETLLLRKVSTSTPE